MFPEVPLAMQFLLMFVVCLAFFPYTPPGGVPDATWSTLLTSLTVLTVGLTAEGATRVLAWFLRHRPENRSAILRWYPRVRLGHFILTVGLYLVVLFAVGWGSVVRKALGLEQAILLDEILILLPFLISLALSWLSFYAVEQMIVQTAPVAPPQPFWGRWAYLWFHLRHYLGLVLAPILLFTGIHETLLYFMPWAANETWFLLLSVGLLLLLILVVTPWLLTILWSARPLDPGPLRERLEAAARRLNFRYTQILLWNTRGGVANAMVTGIFRWPRYVLLSDGLLQGLKPEEIEAVFGHEVGHVKHHHMTLYLGFMILSIVLLASLGQMVLPPIPSEDTDWLAFLSDWPQSFGFWGGYLVATACLGGYVWLVFGFLSRRCERQADVYGCKAVSCVASSCTGHDENYPRHGDGRNLPLCPTGIRIFVTALERVADLNGIRRDKPSWRHSSIARRVEFLERLSRDPSEEGRFQRRLFFVQWGLVALLAGLVSLVAWHGADVFRALL